MWSNTLSSLQYYCKYPYFTGIAKKITKAKENKSTKIQYKISIYNI